MVSELVKYPSKLIKNRLALCGIFFLHGAIFACWAGRIPQFQAKLHLSNGSLGLSLFCLAIGALLAMPATAALSHIFGSARITRFFSLAFLLMLTLLPVANDWFAFSALLFVFGFSQGGMDVAMNAHSVTVERLYQRQIMSTFHAMFSMGGIAGAGLSIYMNAMSVMPFDHFSRFAIGSLPLLMMLCFNLQDESDEKLPAPAFSWPDTRLAALSTIAFCSFIGEGAIADWSAVYLNSTLHASAVIAPAGFGLFCLTMTIFRFGGDRVIAHFGDRYVLIAGALVAAISIAGTLFTQSVTLALFFYALAGIGFACLIPVVFSAAGRAANGSTSTAIAGVASAGYFGFLIAPPIIGQLADFVSLRLALLIPVLLSLLIVVLAAPALQIKAQHSNN